jgi:DNA topoisomerase VI subunit B
VFIHIYLLFFSQLISFFVPHENQSVDIIHQSPINNRLAKATREIDRSLRLFVMDNRKKMRPAITDEEKGLQILAQGR